MNPFFDVSLPVEQRLDWLLREMTIEEKLHCMATSAASVERLGIRGFSVGGEAAHGVEGRNDQNHLGTPDVATSFVQPVGMSATWDKELIRQAGEVTGVEARVVYHRHPDRGLSRWAPTVDLERDPRWGRTEEGYGEDPLLTGEMASAYIQGMQGSHPSYLRVAATLKHFYANNTEAGRGYKSATIDPRNRMELYLEPFRRCIQKGGAEAVMAAYNKINGVPGMLNPEIRHILKEQYGLRHAVCDGGAMEMVAGVHHYCGTDAESLALAVKAGVDAMSDNPQAVEKAAREAFELGLLSEAEIDGAIRNMFRTKLRLGIYDSEPCNPYDLVTEEDIDCERHREVSRKVAQESVVLLKNEGGVLPLRETEGIALIGPYADVWYHDWYGGEPPYRSTLLEGIEKAAGIRPDMADGEDRVIFRYRDKTVALSDDGSLVLSDQPEVFVKQEWGEEKYTFYSERTGKYWNLVLQREAAGEVPIRADKEEPFDWFVTEIFHLHREEDHLVSLTTRMDMPVTVGADGKLTSAADGTAAKFAMEMVESGLERACRLAKKSKTVLLALGCHPLINAKEEVDRRSLALPPAQEELLRRVCGANPNVVLVLFSNYPYAVNWAQEHVPAIIWSATGSQDMGFAMADALFGRTAPAGRLNFTWYRSEDQLPDIDDYDIIKQGRTYRYFEGEALYPFGHGLTYSQFAYSDLCAGMADQGMIRVSFRVKNTGGAQSDEVVQVYGRAPASRVKKPRLQLLAFSRLKDVRPGEERTAEFLIPAQEFRFYDTVSRTLMVEEGTYRIFAGRSSADLPLCALVRVPGRRTGSRDLSRRHPADHFDDYENMILTEGHFGYPAAALRDEGGQMRLVYRDCRVSGREKTLVLHMRSEQGCRVEVLADDKKIGEWEGDTRSYEPSPRFPIDERSRRESAWLRAQWQPVYTDVRIGLSSIGEPRADAKLCLNIRGDIRLCFFRTEE